MGHRGRQGLVKAHLTNKEELSYEKEKYHETYLSRMRGHQGLVKVYIMTKLSYETVSWDLLFSYLYNPRAMTVRRWSHEMSSA